MKKEKLQELAFLKRCNHNDLKKVADCIIYGIGNGNKKPRLAERLTKTKAYNDNRENSLPNAVDAIIDEYLRCGGTTIANTFRQEGVSYREILTDICQRLGVYYNEKMPAAIIERNLITYLMECCLISDHSIAENLYSIWCINQPFYKSGISDIDKKINCILDYCFSYSIDDEGKVISHLKTKTMPFIVKEMDKLVNTDAKDYKGWLNDIFKQATTPSINTPLGALNPIAHSINYIQGAAYDVTFPATIYIIYMKIKNS